MPVATAEPRARLHVYMVDTGQGALTKRVLCEHCEHVWLPGWARVGVFFDYVADADTEFDECFGCSR